MEEKLKKTRQDFKVFIIGPQGSGGTAYFNQAGDPEKPFTYKHEPTENVGEHKYAFIPELHKERNTMLWNVGDKQQFESFKKSKGGNLEGAALFLITLGADTFKNDPKAARKTLEEYKKLAEPASADAKIRLVITKTDLIDEKEMTQFKAAVSGVAKEMGLDDADILYTSAKNNNINATWNKINSLIEEAWQFKNNKLTSKRKYSIDGMLDLNKTLSKKLEGLNAELSKLDKKIAEDFQASQKLEYVVTEAEFQNKHPLADQRPRLSEAIEQLETSQKNFQKEIEVCQSRVIEKIRTQVTALATARDNAMKKFGRLSSREEQDAMLGLSRMVQILTDSFEACEKACKAEGVSIEDRQEAIKGFRTTLEGEIRKNSGALESHYSWLGKPIQRLLNWLDSELGISILSSYSIFSKTSRLLDNVKQAADMPSPQGSPRPPGSSQGDGL